MVAPQRARVRARPLHLLGVEAMAELRRHDPPLAIGRDRVPDQRLGETVAIALGGVDDIHAQLARAAHEGHRPRLM
jgi:hypothetical protein